MTRLKSESIRGRVFRHYRMPVDVHRTVNGNSAVIITVAAPKGGVGKTTLAYELAAVFGAVLMDFDWDPGGATAQWGARADARVIAALEAEGSKPPRPRAARARPRLLPNHPDLQLGGWRPEEVADRVEAWASAWQSPVVVDTHPGIGELAYGAMAAAHVVAVPVLLQERELDAVAGMRKEFGAHYPLVLCPNRVPTVPPARQLRRLRELAAGLPVAPPLGVYPWLARRARRSALTLTAPSLRAKRAVGELQLIARFLEQVASGRPG